MNVEYSGVEGNIDDEENRLLEEAAAAYQRNTGKSIEDFDFEDMPDIGSMSPREKQAVDEQRFNAIATAIIQQQQRRAYFDSHILPLTGWGIPVYPSQAQSGHLPGDILGIQHGEGSQVWFEDVIGKVRQADHAACFRGCICKCECEDYDV